MAEVWSLVRTLLLAVANTAPLLAKRWLGSRCNRPLDAGRLLNDGRPWLGPSKTWRGVIAATVASALVAPLLGLDLWTGVLVGLGAMAGDALSSFTRRRLGVASSGKATGLDQVPEALLPLWLAHAPLGLDSWQAVGATLLFFLLELPLARLFHRFGLRDQPY